MMRFRARPQRAPFINALSHEADSVTEPLTARLPSPEDTDRMGGALARALADAKPEIDGAGLALRLEGDLGAGKTSLMRAALRALGWSGPVKSPTFTLLETYALSGFVFNHFDFYRFETPEEFDDAGFAEEFGPGRVCATEWSVRAEPFLPPADLFIALAPEGLGRVIEVRAATPAGIAVLEGMRKAWNGAV